MDTYLGVSMTFEVGLAVRSGVFRDYLTRPASQRLLKIEGFLETRSLHYVACIQENVTHCLPYFHILLALRSSLFLSFNCLLKIAYT